VPVDAIALGLEWDVVGIANKMGNWAEIDIGVDNLAGFMDVNLPVTGTDDEYPGRVQTLVSGCVQSLA
jgi:hypothetical protein